MTTGSFENWAGTISEIGPVYPFVGSEGILVIIGVVFWVAWHVFQMRQEAADLSEQDEHFKSGD